jgi:solute carrier family 25 S-adenosylmethionine transporter 26
MTNDGPSTWSRSLAAGAVAGTLTDISLYPLDTLKTRLQSAAGFFPSGGFSRVYRGVGSAIVGSAPSAALFFITYDETKRFLFHLFPSTREQGSATAPLVHMAAGSAGEMAGCVIRVPVEVIKQRAQAAQHPSSWASARHVWRSHSGLPLVRAMYRGGGVTLLREVPFTMVQFSLWEALRTWHARRFGPGGAAAAGGGRGGGDGIPAVASALYGSAAGAVAAVATTPLDVVKTRLMLAPERVGAVRMLRTVLRESGARGLFAGVVPRMMWISIGGAVFLGSYQWSWNAMQEWELRASSVQSEL